MHSVIYGLVDPRTLLVRYVGMSSRGLIRAREHSYTCKARGTHKDAWINSLRTLRLDYTIVVLEENPADLADAERFWIAFGRACGWPLTNLTDGGDGLFNPTAETRARMAAARKGAKRGPPSQETRARIAAALRGKPRPHARTEPRKRGPLSPTTRARIGAALRGKPLTAEHRAKLRKPKARKRSGEKTS